MRTLLSPAPVGTLPPTSGMSAAPFYDDIADASPEAEAWWAMTPNGVRIRVARLGTGPKGTVLLLPGRTEFVEKYGPAGRALAELGYGTACVDWRGQGLADRFLSDLATGHVHRFDEYQEDLEALCDALPTMGLVGPLVMLAHSMGGSIGFRAMHRGLALRAVVFTGPMWGIVLSPFMRPFARTISRVSRPLGLGARYAPGTVAETYVLRTGFEENQLTSDPAMFAWMQRQVAMHPELALGGPSIAWVDEALAEIAAQRRMPSPDLPCLTVVGSEEKIIDLRAVHARMARWPTGKLEVVQGARHEVMMETPARREAFFQMAGDLFDAAVAPAAPPSAGPPKTPESGPQKGS